MLIIFGCLFFLFVKEVSAENKHIVRPGDTFWNISQRYQVTLEWLIRSNPAIRNPNLIFPGQEIVIPSLLSETKNKNINYQFESRLLTLINEERTQLGLKQLLHDNTLSNAAKLKSFDMKKYGYVSHNSPTYGNANSMLKELNISFQIVKESIGAGYDSADEIFSAWLNSPINRETVLNAGATHIGIGYANGGTHRHYWTVLILRK